MLNSSTLTTIKDIACLPKKNSPAILPLFKVEELIADLPSLTIFDEFVLKACGFYCRASCKRGRGFPSVILNQWNQCSVPSVHVNLSVGTSAVNNTISVVDQASLPSGVNDTHFVMVRKIHCNNNRVLWSQFEFFLNEFPPNSVNRD